jgi:hypothetical protein
VDGILSEKEREKVLYPGRVTLTSESSTTFPLRRLWVLDPTARHMNGRVLGPVLHETSDI